MYRSVVDYMFKNMFISYLDSIGGAPKFRGVWGNLPLPLISLSTSLGALITR